MQNYQCTLLASLMDLSNCTSTSRSVDFPTRNIIERLNEDDSEIFDYEEGEEATEKPVIINNNKNKKQRQTSKRRKRILTVEEQRKELAEQAAEQGDHGESEEVEEETKRVSKPPLLIEGKYYTLDTLPTAVLDNAIEQCHLSFPQGTYQVIYVDPPWRFRKNSRCLEGIVNYPTMALEDIKDLKVGSLAETDCVLFLWACGPMLPEAFEVIKAWGFAYRAIYKVWRKVYPNNNPVCGPGWWSRPNTEFVLAATRGSPLKKWKTTCKEPQEYKSPRPGRHSQKPAAIRDKIYQFMNVKRRIELFARDTTPGWDAWGLEIDGFFYHGCHLQPNLQNSESQPQISKSRKAIRDTNKAQPTMSSQKVTVLLS